MTKLIFLLIVNLIVVVTPARLSASNDKLYFEHPSSANLLFEPENNEESSSKQNTGQTGEVPTNNFEILYGPRHDEFDWNLTKKVLNNDKQNTVVSPFLVKLLLAILAEMAGPGSAAHREIVSVLPSIDTETDLLELYASPFVSLLEKSADYELSFGAKLFIDKFIRPRQKFVSIVKSFYKTDVQSLDFENGQKATDIINAWGASVTKNHIKNTISADDAANSVILLANLIYFNGLWTESFDEKQTTPQQFWVDSKANLMTPFMTKISNLYYGESDELDAKFLRLPYNGGKFAMYIVLPSKIGGLDELVSNIDCSDIRAVQFMKTQIKVSLPKFKILHTTELNEILKSLGIHKMFTTPASLPQLDRGPSKDRLQVSNVLQKIGIEINEKGTIAYAETVPNLDRRIDSSIEFKADRPFLFFVIDEPTGTLMFSGKVVRPS